MTSPKGSFSPKNRPYDVEHYAITVRLDASTGQFNNVIVIKFKTLKELKTIEFDCQDLKISKVQFLPSQTNLEFKHDHANHALTITPQTPWMGGQHFVIEISYEGKASIHHDGFFSTNDPDNPSRPTLFFTHFEAIAARKFFPCNDEPYDKATSEFIIETDSAYQTLSNGRKVLDQTFTSDSGQSRRRTHWVQDQPHSTYLMSVAVGIFSELKSRAQGVDMEVYTAPRREKDIEFAMDVMKRSLAFFENFYDIKYPWARYGMVGVPGYLWGGMEHTTISSMRESAMTIEDSSAQIQKLRIAAVTAHELAHQWFGNYVTMKWWDDIWLNEAFASYMETAAIEHYFQNDYPNLETVTAAWEDYFRQEDGPRSHPIVSGDLPSPDDAFDSINYTKGEQVLRMLDFYIGRENFRKGINRYMTRHALGNATYKDFMAAMQEVSGVDLQGFINSWLLSRGYPILRIKESWDESRREFDIVIHQNSNHASDATIFDLKIPVVFHWKKINKKSAAEVIHLNEKTKTLNIPLDQKPDWVTFNPGGAALLKINRRAPESEWSDQAILDPDPVARLSALFELVRPWIDREATALEDLSETAKKTISKALSNDPSPYVRAIFADKLLNSKWSRYPDHFSEILYTQAQNPTHLPAQDNIGLAFVQSRYWALLGKSTHAQARQKIYAILKDKNSPLDILGGAAWGMAGFSDLEAVDSLKSALNWQSGRSYAFRRSILLAFGAISHPGVLAELSAIFKGPDANNEIVGGLLRRFGNNEILKNSPEGAGFISDFVTQPNTFNDQMKARAISCLEESKSAGVQNALETIARKASTERLRSLAQKVLEKNFNG